MKTIHSLILPALIAAFARQLSAATFTSNFTNGFANNGLIPDGNTTGWFDTRTLSGIADNSIIDVNVSLNIAGGYSGDLYAYLTHNGGFSVLLNRPGRTVGNSFGYGDAGLDITLDDSAAYGDIHAYQTTAGFSTLIGNGSAWLPDGRDVNPLFALEADVRTHPLAELNGLNPNGDWTLFVADVANGEQATFVSWGLTIASVAVPEPSSLALGILGALTLFGFRAKVR